MIKAAQKDWVAFSYIFSWLSKQKEELVWFSPAERLHISKSRIASKHIFYDHMAWFLPISGRVSRQCCMVRSIQMDLLPELRRFSFISILITMCAPVFRKHKQTTNNNVKERRYYYEFKLDGRYRQRRKTVLQKVAKQICGLLVTVCWWSKNSG